MAQISKRKNGHFQIIASLGYDKNGKQIRKTTTFVPPEGTTPKKAEKLAKEFAIQFQKKCEGYASLDENITFAELVERYRKSYMPNELKAVTKYTYDLQIEKYLLPAFANVKLKKFTPLRFTNFFADLELNPASCRKLYTILKSIFTFAVNQNILTKSPCVNVILPKSKEAENEKPAMTFEQIDELVKMLKSEDVANTQFSAIILTLLYTGMRSGECLGLQWKDIDFTQNLIYINHNLVYDGKDTWLDTPKTKKSKRSIAMSEELKGILLNQKFRQSVNMDKMGKGYNPLNMVFTSATGGFKDRSGLLKEFKRFIKNTDFNYISLHTLRHVNATLLIMQGYDIKLVSGHLGHSNISTTGDIYADVIEESKRKMAETIALRLA